MSLARLPAPLVAVIAVFRNRWLRRVLGAFVGFSMAEWASWIAILVYAYSRGGPTETGIAALIQLAPSAVVAPLAATVGDHVRRERALLAAYMLQTLALGLTGAALLAAAPAPLVYVLAATAAASITLTRPIQAAMLPSLSRAPSELTAANVASGMVETGAMLIGPALAGVALAASGPGVVFVGSSLAVLAGGLAILGIPTTGVRAELPAGQRPRWSNVAGEAFAGFRLLVGDPNPRSVLLLLGAAAVLWGALDVLLVVLAIDLLALGDAGVGYLNSALGAGGILGAVISVLLVGRSRLAAPLVAGVVTWSLALLLLGLVPGLPAAVLLLATAGMGLIVMDVAGRTLLQRVAPDRLLTRVFGVLEGGQMAALSAGAIVAPALVALVGARGAFVVAGALVIATSTALWAALRRVDSVGVARSREVEILRRIPIFAPLGPAVLEGLAASVVPVHAHAGSVIVRQGERGERFYVIVSGVVVVEVDGRRVREQGQGDSFGEIALLRDVPRTATVTALESTELLVLDRRPFLEAVTGQPASATAAEEIVGERLAVSAAEEADASA